jgi:aspartyl-tRNA(Asn)/glutamyl-tRNA(Gln) amidotransferase subunit B
MNGEGYLPTIGLEVHAELATATKMFCACVNAPQDAEANAHVCPICMGHPGTLPAVNARAVESVVKVGLALEGTIATYSEFDRKNYFYPDIPKGYQISQYAYPIVTGGSLNGVAITRVHLEEDTARSLHDQGEGTVVDYNRAGVPLMELVTEPVIHTAEDASAFAKELQLLLRTLGVSDANMERGEMRVEANISVGRGGALGTKVEVKNLNSFKAVEGAIRFEIARHIDELEKGGTIIQETRGWDEVKGRTFSQRKKESSHDYRYFPDPDIPKMNLEENGTINISRLSEIMPILPSKKRLIYKNLGLPRNQIEVLVTDQRAGPFFDQVALLTEDPEVLMLASNYLTSDIIGAISADQTLILRHEEAGKFVELMSMLKAKEATSRVAKDILPKVVFEGAAPRALMESMGLKKVGTEELDDLVMKLIAEHPKVVEEYRTGKVAVLQFLVGQGMRLTKGSADPEDLARLFRERIG